MGRSRKHAKKTESPADRERREQEVVRANRELAAYFRGRRTEREARAALKIIKAFVRERERRGLEGPPLTASRARKRSRAGDAGAAGANDRSDE